MALPSGGAITVYTCAVVRYTLGMMRRDVGTKYAIEYWGNQYGEETWIETGYVDEPTREAAEQILTRCFPNDPTRIVEYTTTSRIVSEQPVQEGT